MMKPFSRALSAKHAQQGFTLIELMIALVIGLAVVLGAGKLFLIGLQGFRDVEALGNKQETINFAANTLVRDIRRANVDKYGEPLVNFNGEDGELEIEFLDPYKKTELESEKCGIEKDENEEYELASRLYKLSNSSVENKGYSLEMAQKYICDTGYRNPQPLVSGFAAEGFGCSEGCDGKGALRLYLELYVDVLGGGERIDFYAINRTWAVTNDNTASETPSEEDEKRTPSGQIGK